MNFLAQKISGFKKRVRSFSYGITYLRSADFAIPSILRINGNKKKIAFINAMDSSFIYEFTEICLNDCYQLAALKSQLGAIKTIVDIGANQGLFIVAARQHFAKASIACYEPNPALEKVLDPNVRALNAKVFYEAVTRENCKMNLHFGESDLHTTAEAVETGTINGTAFHTLVERAGGKIDILKMDCEGGEWDLFADAAVWDNIRSVTMEYHLWAKAGSTAGEVATILEKLGFRIISHTRLSEQFGLITAIKEN